MLMGDNNDGVLFAVGVGGRCGKHASMDAGSLDTSSPVTKKIHYQAVDEIERKMKESAPKAQEGNYKIEDIFDQSYKDLMKDGKSLAMQSITSGVCHCELSISPLVMDFLSGEKCER